MRHVNEPDTFNYTPINAHSSEFEELDTVLNQMMERINDLFQKEKQFTHYDLHMDNILIRQIEDDSYFCYQFNVIHTECL